MEGRSLHPTTSLALDQSAFSPHLGIINAPSPRRRDHLPQPPNLTTSLAAASYQAAGLVSAGPTPTPTTSLSTPFSQPTPSPYLSYHSSPGPDRRGSSPMASRQSGAFAAAYNPQEWGPVTRSPQISTGSFSPAPQHGPPVRNRPPDQDPTAPPPYSPRRAEPSDRARSGTILSSAEASSPAPSQHSMPRPSSAALQADQSQMSRQRPSRPASIIYASESNATAWPAVLPPPPPSQNPAPRSSSTTSIARIGSSGVSSSSHSHGIPASTLGPTSPINSLIQDSREGSPYLGNSASNLHGVPVPPSAKRAVSTGAIGSAGFFSRPGSQSGSGSPSQDGTWEPGMPLPGPPPGPPPSASRSQSASGAADSFSRYIVGPGARPKSRYAPYIGTSLGAVPPTPVGWADSAGQNTDGLAESARVGTSLTMSPVDISAPASSLSAHPGMAPAVLGGAPSRAPSMKGIRQRRSESRTARESQVGDTSAASPSPNPWADSLNNVPNDLTIPTGGTTALSRRRTITKSTPRTPRSSRSTAMEEHSPMVSSENPQSAPLTGSARHTPRADSGRPPLSTSGSIQTPPFSPNENPFSLQSARDTGNILPPKSLPTPPPQQSRPSTSLHIPPSHLQIRPISHILHMPNEASGIPAPLSPRRLSSVRSDNSPSDQPDQDSFVRDGLDRARAFFEKELHAATDDDRLRLFSDYILAESRIRRRRYAPSFDSFDIGPTRERLFDLKLHAPRRSSGLQHTTVASPIEAPPSHPPETHPQDFSERSRSNTNRPESMWWTNYQPALSPIASMSMNDDQSSRGRAPSRWWESQTGSESGGGPSRVGRSKRESKYMGLPLRDAQSAMDGEDPSLPEPGQTIYGENEYPPEKVGWHESEASTTPAMPPPLPSTRAAIDVSRLITLPPPYPRHYPAVQNQHPDLSSFRTLVRNVSDLAELDARRERYQSSTEALRKDVQASTAEDARNFRVNTQAQIQEGSITYAEAAEAEAAMKSQGHASEKHRVQAEFDSFQDVVLNPLHNLLNSRISQTSQHLNELRRKLLDDAQLHNPNETQTAGDERPELLEQLTQFKWLFEAREQLHREVFKLLTERNDKYRAIVTLPYQQSGNKDKIRETLAFFARDTQDRTMAFENEVLKRHTEFLSVIEDNVLGGVEAQLSAFWDIAPGLLTICQKIPESNPRPAQVLRYNHTTLPGQTNTSISWPGIQIPSEEVQENPSYRQFPMQYLYSLLLHAERSTYQFIESQVNLLCLLHEAKTGVMTARVKCWEAENLAKLPTTTPSSTSGSSSSSSSASSSFTIPTSSSSTPPLMPPPTSSSYPSSTAAATTPTTDQAADNRPQDPTSQIKTQARSRLSNEEVLLTTDLKERVEIVEGQWIEALGAVIGGTRERVKSWLVDEGGWDGELFGESFEATDHDRDGGSGGGGDDGGRRGDGNRRD